MRLKSLAHPHHPHRGQGVRPAYDTPAHGRHATVPAPVGYHHADAYAMERDATGAAQGSGKSRTQPPQNVWRTRHTDHVAQADAGRTGGGPTGSSQSHPNQPRPNHPHRNRTAFQANTAYHQANKQGWSHQARQYQSDRPHHLASGRDTKGFGFLRLTGILSLCGWLTFASSCAPLVAPFSLPNPVTAPSMALNDTHLRAQRLLAKLEQSNFGDENTAGLNGDSPLPIMARRADAVTADTFSAGTGRVTRGLDRPTTQRYGSNLASITLSNDAQNVANFLSAQGQSTQAALDTLLVQPVFFQELPWNLEPLSDIETRKEIYLTTLLPLVLKVNDDIMIDRARLLELAVDTELATSEDPWLLDLAQRYYETDGTVADLLVKVAPLPVDLVLAQSIEESGWGTSRFALQAHALFGQRVWSDTAKGLIPFDREEGLTFKVRAFSGLEESIAQYALNLNRHKAYAGMRARRASLMQDALPVTGLDLVDLLDAYSTERERYMGNIKTLIIANKLHAFNELRLRKANPMAVNFDQTSATLLAGDEAAIMRAANAS